MSTFATVTYLCAVCATPCAVSEQMSGNNIGAVYWSDTRIIAPMLDTDAMPFLQCPSCHKFFDTRKQKGKVDNGSGWRAAEKSEQEDTKPKPIRVSSHLTLDTAQLLLRQLEEAPDPDSGDLAMVRRRLLLLANDIRTERNPMDSSSPAGKESAEAVFREQAEALLAMPETSSYLKAEILRELGRFDESLAAFDAVPETDGWAAAVPQVRKKAEAHDSTVFVLESD